MRVTSNTIFRDYQKNLNETQLRVNNANQRISSGKKNLSISDNTSDVVDANLFSNKISQNEGFLNTIHASLDKMKQTDTTLGNIGDRIQKIREYVIDASKSAIGYNHFAIANTVKDVLKDIISLSNADHNGNYLFSGTMNTPRDIENANPGMNKLPFELVEGTPTAANPSGLSIQFKGNNEDLNVKTSDTSTETVNTKAEDIFGSNGVETLETIIDIYNIMAFDGSGNQRQANTLFTNAEKEELNSLQRVLAESHEKISNLTSINGSKINRMQDLSDYLETENLRLSDYRSLKEDTDIAKTAIELRKEENILSFALQIGSRINQLNLFQFLR